MKFMIALLIAALPVASVAQSQPVQAPGASGVALPKTTEVMVILTPKQGVTREQVMAIMPSEIRETVKLYLDGKIRQWYSRGDGKGVIFLIDAKTQDEARAVMGLRVDQKDDALTIASRIPLADFSIEIELHCFPNLGWHDGHDLLAGDRLLRSQNDHHFGGFRQRHAGRAWSLPGL